MTKYYFISYVSCNKTGIVYGHCLMEVNSISLNDIADKIKKANNFDNLPVILCLKDLIEDEYKMLNGEKNERTKSL